MTQITAHVLLTIKALEGYFGGFKVSVEHYPLWDAELAHFSPEDLARGARGLSRHHTHGAPSLAQVIQAVEGKWCIERHPKTDCHGVINEGAPYATFHVKRCTFTNEPLLAFDDSYNWIEWPSQNHIASTKRVLERHSQLLPSGVKERLIELESRKAPRPDGYIADRVDFRSGLLGQ